MTGGSGSAVRGTGSTMRDTGSAVRDTGSAVHDTGSAVGGFDPAQDFSIWAGPAQRKSFTRARAVPLVRW
ncbi:hypothetical protein ACGFNU_32630 [Spirillospora sp. NPDC048911]|uniref:hypothetical protein n=1 Tax=Spirillospora sp. NPDC048911 TaxID=3364527 RepID=UPI0037147B07